MEPNGMDTKVKPVMSDLMPQKETLEGALGKEEDAESKFLLPSSNDGISNGTPKTRRKVQWNDTNGNKLAEVLEFQPSDASDSDNDDSNTCLCTIM